MKDTLQRAIKSMISCASYGLIEALIEINYFKKLYSDADLIKLQDSAQKISADTAEELFGNSNLLSVDDLAEKLANINIEWLWNDESIREKLHLDAKVEMLHINQEEARR